MNKLQILQNAEVAFIEKYKLQGNIRKDGFRAYSIENFMLMRQHLLKTLKEFKLHPQFYMESHVVDDLHLPVRFKINPDQRA